MIEGIGGSMGKNYGLVETKRMLPPAAAVHSFFARIGATLSGDRGKWTLVRDAESGRGVRSEIRIFRMRLAGDGVPLPDFSPGQYVFLSFPGRGILSSPRPFTIASPPQEGRWLELYGKDSGEWSGAAKLLASTVAETGAAPVRARVVGPFGRFSYLAAPGTGRFVFLAGGMGAAPFLSMLRFMADEDREGRVLLLWGARTREDLFAAYELEEAAERLGGFRFVPVLSHDPLWSGERGRVDREKLERFVPAFFGSSQENFEWNSASYWLCGPPSFRKDLIKTLRSLDVRGAAIHEERFCI
jgi:NAD(P)H-flavin reductase